MKDQGSVESRLILLVGSNPLPNYLSACALRPGAITLVYTKETEQPKDRLKRVLGRALGATTIIDEAYVEDATRATTVSAAIRPLMSQATHLNYTGGTKVMAAHARLAFRDAGGAPDHASYLDEGGPKHEPRLRFDDGNAAPLPADIPLTLETVLALHGITYTPRSVKPPAPTVEDAREILYKVLANPKLAETLYTKSNQIKCFKKPDKALAEPFRADEHGLRLSLPVFPIEAQLVHLGNRKEKESWFEQWYKFIGGEWLEVWLGAQIDGLSLAPKPEITVGVNAKRVRPLEVDVAAMRGHRAYFISCTTDSTMHICKSKLFEVAVRSRQLGGDLARAALVCLANRETVAALQADIDDVWGASNTTRVFGLDDIRRWADCTTRPNQHTLKTWLES